MIKPTVKKLGFTWTAIVPSKIGGWINQYYCATWRGAVDTALNPPKEPVYIR